MTTRLFAAPRRLGPLLLGALLVAGGAGCQTYRQQTSQFSQYARSGSLTEAVADINRQAEAHRGSKDEIIWRLEQGATLRMAGLADLSLVPRPLRAPDPAPAGEAATVPLTPLTPDDVHALYLRQSNAAFDRAEERVDDYERQARVKVGSELGAIFTNQASLPYRGYAYDKVMLDTYKALNDLHLGRRDAARVDLNRALQRQRDAVAENARRIAETQDAARQARHGGLQGAGGQSAVYDPDRALTDPRTAAGLQAALDASLAHLQPYGDYVNPFSVLLDGLFFTALGENGSDWERGRKSFERVAGMVPENPYVRADLALARAVAEGQSVGDLTYVIFETGTGPWRDEVRIDIPTFVVSSRLAYVGASFPRLEFNDDHIGTLAIRAAGQSFSTATVASMDSVVANDFKNEWPAIVTRTILTTATKAVAQATLQKQLNDHNDALGSLLGAVGATLVNMGTTIADTRTWTTLPKEFQYARLATPPDRRLTLTAGAQSRTISLEPGSINVVYVKSMSSASPLLVAQFVLK